MMSHKLPILVPPHGGDGAVAINKVPMQRGTRLSGFMVRF
jgi:hypothetical protein